MGKTTTDMKLVPISKLVPYANNARTHSPEQVTKLRSSLREFGFINPVIIDRDYGIIAGHGRILAAKAEGITDVPCVFGDHLTEAQKKAYILADNRYAMDAGWDEEITLPENYQRLLGNEKVNLVCTANFSGYKYCNRSHQTSGCCCSQYQIRKAC